MQRQTIPCVVLTFVIATLVLSGCGGFRRMTAVMALRNAISSKFHIAEVQISSDSNNDLAIWLTDDKYDTATREANLAQAQQIAEFVRDTYRDIKTVNAIRISMVTKTNPDGSMFQRHLAFRGAYVFDRNAKLKVNTLPPNPPTPRDLLLYGDQAEDGTVRGGMRLLPTFGAHGAKELPATVDLDLAAFSAGPIFRADHRFVLTADGKTLAEGSAQFQSSGTIADGQTAEFMTITIGYANFKQLANARESTMTIGPKKIVFTAVQRSIFREMVAEVEASVGGGGSPR